MGNCSGKNNRAGKKYTRRKSKGASLNESRKHELNDFDQQLYSNNKYEIESGVIDADTLTSHLAYTPNTTDYMNYIAPFDDSSKFMLAVNKEVKILDSVEGNVLETLAHPKQVTQCFSFKDDEGIITTCRDGIVRMWRIDQDSQLHQDGDSLFELKGHKISCTTGCISLGETVLATGARDYETILWDLEDGKKTQSKRIDRNMITDMKWLPSDNNTFIQCSEDLRLRFFDIREGLDVAQETVVGTNFAGSCDIDESGKYIVTGHKGFNNSGCYVKLWDVRSFSDTTVEPVMEFEHSFSVVSVRFLYTPTRKKDTLSIISASADKTMRITDLEGNQKSITDSPESFTAMCPLRNAENCTRTSQQDTDCLVATGNTKPQLTLFSIDDDTFSIVPKLQTK
ncbi:unnamed protein product [Moneuplotes crassus]|uniref:Uncharacterized protein n=1 Tax=Euplotes crassus TaxID=5936 RepID=A0AAD1UUJ5_EUPCR|nr:unnamed protein product [Moneuplotes crassus]